MRKPTINPNPEGDISTGSIRVTFLMNVDIVHRSDLTQSVGGEIFNG